jgi:serine/threonine-protein phosphatase 2A regulatory subunit B''
VPRENVPQFYYPAGKPVDKEEIKRAEVAMDKWFESIGKDKQQVKLDDMDQFCTEVTRIPKIFKKMIFQMILKKERMDEKSESIPKQTIATFYKKEFESLSEKKRTFKVISGLEKDHIAPDDFKPLFRHLLDTHPGLEFLQATPEFQDRYADTVVMRIFFHVDHNDDGKITWRDFKLSNLNETF